MQPPQGPYRAPAAGPAVASPPSRKIALIANAVLAVVLFGSFGACMQYGCSSDHLSEDASMLGALVAGAVCLAATIVAVVVYAMNLKRADAGTSVVGLVLTIVFGVASVVLSPIFWLVAGTGAAVGLGGWGRPLRVRRRAVTPGVRASSEWANGPRPSVDALDRAAREVLRDLWLHDARKEHASVPAFGRVAWQLVALGAPSDLVRRAHQSCLQEIDHAERCFALASAYAGEDLGVQDMPELHASIGDLPRDRQRALVKVATEALVDGALLEDFNAELAATALDDVRDAAAREALVRIVDDERDHARLAWDIIAFCVERGGARVANALRATFAAVPDEPVSLYDPALVARVAALDAEDVLAAHGRVRAHRAAPVFRARKAAAAQRLEAILSPTASTPPRRAA